MIHHADCLDEMARMEPESVDAVVTDPPYDLLSASRNGSRRINNPDNPAGRTGRGFMGKTWDGTGVAFRPETWRLALDVAKPSSYLLAFGGTRTVHRMAVAIEDAGWIIRDMLVWAYASGFPKGKANLKPAWEPIVMARKPGPLRHLNIDECRIETDGRPFREKTAGAWERPDGAEDFDHRPGWAQGETTMGRWPANVILTDPIFDGGVEGVVGGGDTTSGKMMPTPVMSGDRTVFGSDAAAGYRTIETYGDSGTYSRFFLIPKADRGEREPLRGERWNDGRKTEKDYPSLRGGKLRLNHHPTVKPVDLMRHLVRLVTPSGGTVLDPFLGSGTTGIACEMEGFDWIGIEKEAEYVAIAEARLIGVQRGMGLVG